MSLTATDIERALAARHSHDVFVRQCKNGPSQGVGPGTLLILDAWAMARSWANPKMTGYEIKISRGDFLHDDKWRTACGLCNEFYWACPPKLIQKEEVSDQCGLIWITPSGSRCYVKKRAPYRDITLPTELMTYVLMYRTRIREEMTHADVETDSRKRWTAWLRDRNADRLLGMKVSKAIREVISEQIEIVSVENKTLRDALKKHEAAGVVLAEYGLGEITTSPRGDIFEPYWDWALKRELPKLLGIPNGTARVLREAADALDAMTRINGDDK